MYSTRPGFLLVYMAMLPKTLTTTDSMPCTALVSHVHALNLPWGPICPLLGCTLSILTNTNSSGDAHDALKFILPYICIISYLYLIW